MNKRKRMISSQQLPIVCENMFIPQWKPELLFVPPVHHGEKLSQTHTSNQLTKSHGMLDMEASFLHCVNPREVNPIIGQSKETTEYQLNFNVANVDLTERGEFYSPQMKVKMEMEEFKDLSVYLPSVQPSTSSTSTIDELNTPVFDKDAFDFSYVPPMKSGPYDILKFESETYDHLFTTYNKDMINRHQVLQNESTFSNISNNLQQNNETTNYIITPTESSNGNVYNSDCESPPYEPLSYNNSVQSFADVSSVICTPEDSNSSNVSNNRTQLYLNLNVNALTQNTNILNTPDVIDSVVELDGNFNILDLVGSEEITTVNAEDIFSPYTVNSLNQTQSEKPQRRRRKLSYESDDEYIPPKKSRRRYAEASSSDSDSECEQKSTKNRGKSRKTYSTSSDGKEVGVTRYRDLRDKNNEASRKSRMKRKQKEIEVEKECEELNEKNIKLKAQVEELEKTVSSYRENLFKIMLKK